MNQEGRALTDWLSWRPSPKVATATTATTATEAQIVATVATVAVAAERRSYLWQIIEDGHAREVMLSGCPSFEEMRQWYPRASLSPLDQSSVRPPKPMWRDERHLREWLAASGESDPALIEQLVTDFRRWAD